MRLIPTAWTSLKPEDPAVVFGRGRAPFRLQDLLELGRLMAALRGADLPLSVSEEPQKGDSLV
jgi:hypothetical protein